MSTTADPVDHFPAVFYDHDPNGAGGTGQVTGVLCRGACGAPCWEAAPAARAAGRAPTLDEVFESVGNLLDGVDSALFVGADAEETLTPDEVHILRIVQGALNGVGMVVNAAAYGDTTRYQEHVEDYVGPAQGLVQATAFYLDQPLPVECPSAFDPQAVASLQRARALAAQLAAELDALNRRGCAMERRA